MTINSHYQLIPESKTWQGLQMQCLQSVKIKDVLLTISRDLVICRRSVTPMNKGKSL